MLKRVQHDKKKCVIPNLFRNLELGNAQKAPLHGTLPNIYFRILYFCILPFAISHTLSAIKLFHPLLESQGTKKDCDPT
jgi:hypothetical protein